MLAREIEIYSEHDGKRLQGDFGTGVSVWSGLGLHSVPGSVENELD